MLPSGSRLSSGLQRPTQPPPVSPQLGATVLMVKAILQNTVDEDCTEDEMLEEMHHAVSGYLGEGPELRYRARALLREMDCPSISLEDVQKRPMQAARRAKDKSIFIQVLNEVLMDAAAPVPKDADAFASAQTPPARERAALGQAAPTFTPGPSMPAVALPGSALAPVEQLSQQMAWLMKNMGLAAGMPANVAPAAPDYKAHAEDAIRNQDYATAADVMRTALQGSPTHADYRYLLGWALLRSNQLDEAKTHLTQAAKAKPADAKYQAALGEAYLDCCEEQKAIMPLRTAATLAPGVAHYQTLWADCLAALGDNRASSVAHKAETLLRDLLQDEPTNVEYLEDLAIALAAQDKDGAAKAMLQAVIVQAPSRASAYVKMSGLLIKDEAGFFTGLTFAQQARELNQDAVGPNLQIGKALCQVSKLEEAEIFLRIAHNMSADSPRVNGALSEVLNKLERPELAEIFARHAIELSPKVADYHFQLGESLAGQRDYENCVAPYRKVLELDRAYATRGSLHLFLEQDGSIPSAAQPAHTERPKTQNDAQEEPREPRPAGTSTAEGKQAAFQKVAPLTQAEQRAVTIRQNVRTAHVLRESSMSLNITNDNIGTSLPARKIEMLAWNQTSTQIFATLRDHTWAIIEPSTMLLRASQAGRAWARNVAGAWIPNTNAVAINTSGVLRIEPTQKWSTTGITGTPAVNRAGNWVAYGDETSVTIRPVPGYGEEICHSGLSVAEQREDFRTKSHRTRMNGGIAHLAWSPVEDKLAVACNRGNAFIFNSSQVRNEGRRYVPNDAHESGLTYSQELLGTTSLQTVAWHPNGQKIAWGASNEVVVQDLVDETKTKFSVGSTDIEKIDWNADGTRFWTLSNDSTLRLFDVSAEIDSWSMPLEVSGVHMASWNLVENVIAAGFGDGNARLFDGDDGQHLGSLKHSGPVNAVSWSPDGTKLATGTTSLRINEFAPI